MSRKNTCFSLFAFVLTTMVALPRPADPQEFYAGKSIRIIVVFQPAAASTLIRG